METSSLSSLPGTSSEDGGGGRVNGLPNRPTESPTRPPSDPQPPRTQRDSRLPHRDRDRSHTQDGHSYLGDDPSQDPSPPPPVLSLDQLRATRTSNEYSEGPTVAPRSPASSAPRNSNSAITTVTTRGPTNDNGPAEHPTANQRSVLAHNQRNAATHCAPSSRDTALPSRTLGSGNGSEDSPSVHTTQCIVGNQAVEEQRIIQTQPKRGDTKQEELKPLTTDRNSAGTPLVVAVPGTAHSNAGLLEKPHGHAQCCRDCGRCVCPECTRPRVLPSCWLCGRRCVCSAQNVVEYGSCVCCVKALFYHCSSDDEDTCADKPFSCSQSHCCVRWSAVGLLSLVLPCLMCYLPAKGCVAACQGCYDLAKRPGCRCKNSNCKCPGGGGVGRDT